jgi:hypothetical protein
MCRSEIARPPIKQKYQIPFDSQYTIHERDWSIELLGAFLSMCTELCVGTRQKMIKNTNNLFK